MKKLKKPVILILGLCTAVLAGCSDEPAPLPADTTPAQQRGRADAQALIDARFTTERDLHAALLAVKSREWRMRSEGDSLSAKAYVRAFCEHLQQTDAELAGKIF